MGSGQLCSEAFLDTPGQGGPIVVAGAATEVVAGAGVLLEGGVVTETGARVLAVKEVGAEGVVAGAGAVAEIILVADVVAETGVGIVAGTEVGAG